MPDLSGLGAPEPLAPDHDLDSFACGIAALDDWLKRRARRNEDEGASRSFVICESGRVVGYFRLAAGSVTQAQATSKVRRNMPDPIPVVLLGRLAVDLRWQGQGLGRALLREAILRAIGAASLIGVRAMLVHAISADAKRFYEGAGFRASPIDPMTLMVTIREVKSEVARQA